MDPGHGLDLGSGGERIKVFWFFSSEKNILLPDGGAESAN
jgi:hypothetical protein